MSGTNTRGVHARHEPCPLFVEEVVPVLTTFPSQARLRLALLNRAWAGPNELTNDTTADADTYICCRHEGGSIDVVAKVRGSLPRHRKLEITFLVRHDAVAPCLTNITSWLLRTYDVNRLECNLNEGSPLAPLLEQCRFKREAAFDEALFLDGRRCALVVFGLLRADAASLLEPHREG